MTSCGEGQEQAPDRRGGMRSRGSMTGVESPGGGRRGLLQGGGLGCADGLLRAQGRPDISKHICRIGCLLVSPLSLPHPAVPSITRIILHDLQLR